MLLALDTSTLTCRSPWWSASAPAMTCASLEYVVVSPPEKQSEALPGVVGELLARHGVRLAALEGLVVGLGPGSFTGLRIGLATMKALAYAVRLKVAGVSSLAAVALEGPEGPPLYCLAVARKDDLYLGQYRRRGQDAGGAGARDGHVSGGGGGEAGRRARGAWRWAPRSPTTAPRWRAAGVAADRLLPGPRFPLGGGAGAAGALAPGAVPAGSCSRWSRTTCAPPSPSATRSSLRCRAPRPPPVSRKTEPDGNRSHPEPRLA